MVWICGTHGISNTYLYEDISWFFEDMTVPTWFNVTWKQMRLVVTNTK